MELLYTAHVPAGEGPFPTVLALHGWGASAHDLLGLAPVLNRGQALVLCPQGRMEIPIGQGLAGYGWFDITRGGPPPFDELEKAADTLRRYLDAAAERYPIDRRKLVLLGFSQGAVMAYTLFLREPERFTGLAALSGWLPEELVRAVPPPPEVRNSPVLVVHGTEDPMIPVDRARESRQRLTGMGVDLTYREYPMGHEIRPEALRDLVAWLDDKALHPILLA